MVLFFSARTQKVMTVPTFIFLSQWPAQHARTHTHTHTAHHYDTSNTTKHFATTTCPNAMYAAIIGSGPWISHLEASSQHNITFKCGNTSTHNTRETYRIIFEETLISFKGSPLMN
jgi:hypothetical protein